MRLITRLEQDSRLDAIVSAGQRAARLIRPGRLRDLLHGASLMVRGRRRGRALRLAGLAAVSASGLLGGHISFRLAGGANHAEAVPHLVEPGWQHLMAAADLPEGKPVRQMLGEVPVVAIRTGGAVRVLADRCSHMSGPLSDGDLADGCLTCPWHGSVFRIADGAVARGPGHRAAAGLPGAGGRRRDPGLPSRRRLGSARLSGQWFLRALTSSALVIVERPLMPISLARLTRSCLLQSS